jgi:xanthine dehydrogenase iron-sulfur cluster and FAD-binding subunit A
MTEQIKKEAVYEASIKPLLSQIYELCQSHEIAMSATFHLGGEALSYTSNLGEETNPPMVMIILGAIVTGNLQPEEAREIPLEDFKA